MARPSAKSSSLFAKHRHLKHFLIGLLAVVLVVFLWLTAVQIQTHRHQNQLEPFYNTAELQPAGRLGQVVRQQPLGVDVPGGHGIRILYRTQRVDGSYTFSSGMVLIPDKPASGPRPVVAWAHGTLGMGDQCAPTRTKNPVGNIAWVSQMLQKGWVVTATDYAGFGTPGTQGYLVGGAEANDVLNSVRAARDLTAAQAGDQFAVWGHSQGGNSALFSASRAAAYAPDLHLLGAVASAPAAELVTLLNEQYGTVANWVIGPLIATSWPAVNPALKPTDLLTPIGLKNYKRVADQCIVQSTLGGLVRNLFHQKLFNVNPTSLPAWRTMAEVQSAPYLTARQPLMVIESESDKVVLPNTTALYIQQACRQGSDLSTLWLNGVDHQDIPAKSAPQVIQWLDARFNGQTASSDCNEPLPVTPAKPT